MPGAGPAKGSLRPESSGALAELSATRSGLEEADFIKLLGRNGSRELARLLDQGWVRRRLTMVPARGDCPGHGHSWSPSDGAECWTWSVDYLAGRESSQAERRSMEQGSGVHCKYVPGTFIPLANKHNDYLMDREAQKGGLTFSGVEGIAIQDSSLQESMGPICDRSKERLLQTDKGIVYARRKLLQELDAMQETSELPPGVDTESHTVRSASVLLAETKAFYEADKADLWLARCKHHPSVYP